MYITPFFRSPGALVQLQDLLATKAKTHHWVTRRCIFDYVSKYIDLGTYDEFKRRFSINKWVEAGAVELRVRRTKEVVVQGLDCLYEPKEASAFIKLATNNYFLDPTRFSIAKEHGCGIYERTEKAEEKNGSNLINIFSEELVPLMLRSHPAVLGTNRATLRQGHKMVIQALLDLAGAGLIDLQDLDLDDSISPSQIQWQMRAVGTKLQLGLVTPGSAPGKARILRSISGSVTPPSGSSTPGFAAPELPLCFRDLGSKPTEIVALAELAAISARQRLVRGISDLGNEEAQAWLRREILVAWEGCSLDMPLVTKSNPNGVRGSDILRLLQRLSNIRCSNPGAVHHRETYEADIFRSRADLRNKISQVLPASFVASQYGDDRSILKWFTPSVDETESDADDDGADVDRGERPATELMKGTADQHKEPGIFELFFRDGVPGRIQVWREMGAARAKANGKANPEWRITGFLRRKKRKEDRFTPGSEIPSVPAAQVRWIAPHPHNGQAYFTYQAAAVLRHMRVESNVPQVGLVPSFAMVYTLIFNEAPPEQFLASTATIRHAFQGSVKCYTHFPQHVFK